MVLCHVLRQYRWAERLELKSVDPGGGIPDRQGRRCSARCDQERGRRDEADVSTPGGRQVIRSTAYKIARSKTALDEMGKGLGEDMRAKVNAINADRKRIPR